MVISRLSCYEIDGIAVLSNCDGILFRNINYFLESHLKTY